VPHHQHIAFRKLTRSTLVLLGTFVLTTFHIEAAESPSADQDQQPGRSETRFDSFRAQPSSGSNQSQVMDVVATGIGTDPEQAKQNAFSAAIEQAVGVLVDAETIIKNNQVIRDRILTSSQGYLQGFEEVDRWEEGGTCFVRIRARVAAGKLDETLKAQYVVTRKIPGSLLFSNIAVEVDSQEDAREMFRKATADFTPDKLMTVTILDTPPVIENDGRNVKFTVAYRLAPNWQAWQSSHTKLKPLLEAIATKHAAYAYTNPWRSAVDEGWESSTPIDTDGSIVMWLFKGSTPETTTTYWDGYQVFESLKHEASHLEKRYRKYDVRLTLVDAENRAITSETENRSFSQVFAWGLSTVIGPLPYYGNHEFHAACDWTVTFHIDVDELARVDKCIAFVEEVSAHR
jgi:hypothetical protein